MWLELTVYEGVIPFAAKVAEAYAAQAGGRERDLPFCEAHDPSDCDVCPCCLAVERDDSAKAWQKRAEAAEAERDAYKDACGDLSPADLEKLLDGQLEKSGLGALLEMAEAQREAAQVELSYEDACRLSRVFVEHSDFGRDAQDSRIHQWLNNTIAKLRGTLEWGLTREQAEEKLNHFARGVQCHSSPEHVPAEQLAVLREELINRLMGN